jgi:hypothetical protein
VFHRLDGTPGVNFDDGSAVKDLFELLGCSNRGQAARVDDREALGMI